MEPEFEPPPLDALLESESLSEAEAPLRARTHLAASVVAHTDRAGEFEACGIPATTRTVTTACSGSALQDRLQRAHTHTGDGFGMGFKYGSGVPGLCLCSMSSEAVQTVSSSTFATSSESTRHYTALSTVFAAARGLPVCGVRCAVRHYRKPHDTGSDKS